jgi:hypothetical protein
MFQSFQLSSFLPTPPRAVVLPDTDYRRHPTPNSKNQRLSPADTPPELLLRRFYLPSQYSNPARKKSSFLQIFFAWFANPQNFSPPTTFADLPGQNRQIRSKNAHNPLSPPENV